MGLSTLHFGLDPVWWPLRLNGEAIVPKYYRAKPVNPEDRPAQWLLQRYFEYVPETGWLVYKVSAGVRGKRGNRAGTLNGQTGYRAISVEGVLYQEHHVIWALVNGAWPPVGYHIDHINHRRDDNRIANLRCVPRIENHRNMSPRANQSGHHGVVWSKRKQRWRAYIGIGGGKRRWLGMHADLADAVAARAAAEVALGFHANHGLSAGVISTNEAGGTQLPATNRS